MTQLRRPHRFDTLVVALSLIVVAMGCDGTASDSNPTGLTAQFGKPDCTTDPSHPKCGGDDDGSFPGGDVTTLLASGYGVTGDGLGEYTTIRKKRNNGALTSTLNDRYQLIVEEDAARDVCVHFPADATVLSPDHWTEFQAVSGVTPGGDPLCTAIHFQTRSSEASLIAMSPGDVLSDGGKIVLTAFDDQQTTWRWRLIFDEARTGTGITDNGFCISYDGSAWRLTNDPALVDAVACPGVDDQVNLFRVGDAAPGEEGSVWVASFAMTILDTITP